MIKFYKEAATQNWVCGSKRKIAAGTCTMETNADNTYIEIKENGIEKTIAEGPVASFVNEAGVAYADFAALDAATTDFFVNATHPLEARVAALENNQTILTDYPEQDAAKAGQRFWYLGCEWEYLTQEKIDILEWNAEPGFPAPVDRSYNAVVAEGIDLFFISNYTLNPYSLSNKYDINMVGFGYPNKIRNFNTNGRIINSFKNLKLFTALEDIGTQSAFSIVSCSLNSDLINDAFEQLPTTNKVATIIVSNNPGTATCNTAIATAKGYIVVI